MRRSLRRPTLSPTVMPAYSRPHDQLADGPIALVTLTIVLPDPDAEKIQIPVCGVCAFIFETVLMCLFF